MKTHILFPLALMTSLLIAALSTGSRLLLMCAFLIAIIAAVCLISVAWVSATINVSVQFSDDTVQRGDNTFLIIQIRHNGRIPVAPVLLRIPSMITEEDREIRLRDIPGRTQSLRMPIYAAHVGSFTSGIRSCEIEDLLGLFRRTIHPENTVFTLTVLPQTFPTEPLIMAPGDPGSEIMARATEDLNAPSDIRSYQPGDAMKKIHWKLSLRKRELIVRKYDEPVMQDVLILMDCSNPPYEWPRKADIQDALIETTASLFSDQMKTDHPIRMPLSGNHPAEADRSSGLSIALEYLARVDFTAGDRFERILQMESRNLRKVGCVVVVAARLNYAMVDIMIRIYRAGPNLRFYFITYEPEAEEILPLISRLKESGIEVAYVTPDIPE